MNWTLVRKIVRIIGSIAGLCIFLFLVYDGIKKFTGASATLEISWKHVLLALILYLLIYFFQIINFKYIYASLHQNVSLLATIVGYSFSFLPKYIPGYVWGYYSRSDWFTEKADVPAGFTWQASIVEILITVLTASSIWLTYQFFKTAESFWAHSILLLPFVVIIPINRLLTILKFFTKTRKWFKSVEGVPLKHWLIITANSYFQWVLFGLGLWALSQIFSHTALFSPREFFNFIYIFARSWLSGFLAILIPNGLGVREIVLKELLVDANIVSDDLSSVISTLSRLLMLIAEFGWLILAFLVNRGPKKQKYIESIIE